MKKAVSVGAVLIVICVIGTWVWWTWFRVIDVNLLRAYGAAYFDEDQSARAERVLRRVIASEEATAQDHVNLACMYMFWKEELKEGEKDPDLIDLERLQKKRNAKALHHLETACAMDPQLAATHYCFGVLSRQERSFEEAIEHLSTAAELAPGDIPSKLHLATSLEEIGREDEAETLYRDIVARGAEHGGGFFRTALYRLSQIQMHSKQPERRQSGEEYNKKFQALGKSLQMSEVSQQKGNLARVKPPASPAYSVAPPRPAEIRFSSAPEVIASESGAVHEVLCMEFNRVVPHHLFDENARRLRLYDPSNAGEPLRRVLAPDSALLDGLLVIGANGVFLGVQQFTVQQLDGGSWRTAIAGDLDNEGFCSVLLIGARGEIKLLEPREEWSDQTAVLGTDLRVNDACFVDIDHEGDLDLLAATKTGLRLWRNDGRSESTSLLFTEITTKADLPAGDFQWVANEDFDSDQDVDVLAGGGDVPTVLLSSLRGNRFEAIDSSRSGLPEHIQRGPLLADLDHDGFVDAVSIGEAPAFHRNRGDGGFEVSRRLKSLSILNSCRAASLTDLNLDGELDLVVSEKDGGAVARMGSLLADATIDVELPRVCLVDSAPQVRDLDGDGAQDLLGVATSGVALHHGVSKPGHSIQLALMGRKSQRQGIGAVIEVRAGGRYERRRYQGHHETFGLGQNKVPEIVRITWPNGVVQNLIDSGGDGVISVTEVERDPGSCPLLYTWNGTRYEFVTDVLGVTPLGLPIEEGRFVIPDHDELVRIEESQLQAVDGEYRIEITEELREVTYLDRAQLWVVDHPADVEVHPEERFTFPPFPPPHVHTVREPLDIVRAQGSDGQDWTFELSRIDGLHAVPFRPLCSQLPGLVSPHHLEITLPDAVKSARRVRLLMTGWLLWTNASVNVAAGHDPRVEFVPPVLSVPDGEGGFRVSGPPVGFPAGKTKTMVLDVTEALNREDPRLKLFTTIELYWDSIRVAVDDDDAPVRITKVEPKAASLSYRGFSLPISGWHEGDRRKHMPETYDFHSLMPQAPWNQHRGLLTRCGDVRPLLEEIDDRFVVFSSGDAIDLRFDAANVPPLEAGTARTYLLFLDGWAKDGDPNTVHSQTVEPLPFHAMSGYPYGADESYPDDPVHRDYLSEWNTREGRKLIPELSHPANE